MEVNRLNEEMIKKEKYIKELSIETNHKEEYYTNRLKEMQLKLEEKNVININLIEKLDILQKELIEYVKTINLFN
jgi:hypothetical protein